MVSLVLVSPSTVMRLKERSAAVTSISRRSAGAAAMSVMRKQSMVATSGRIIPAPFTTPVRVKVRPPSRPCRETTFGTRSVVMMASAKSLTPSVFRPRRSPGSADSMRSTGSGSPITPVEATST